MILIMMVVVLMTAFLSAFISFESQMSERAAEEVLGGADIGPAGTAGAEGRRTGAPPQRDERTGELTEFNAAFDPGLDRSMAPRG